jgi:glycerol-3-phosphate cytidylyltransferase
MLVIPSAVISDFVVASRKIIRPDSLVVNFSKGLLDDGTTIVEFLEDYLPNDIVNLKGPTFATEVFDNSPSLFTLGFTKPESAELITEIFKNTNFFLDYTTDKRGVEILSAIKNIYAVVLGIFDAKYNSLNTRFMVLTKAFNEMQYLLEIMGGEKNTIDLACGFGDMGLTALNDLSRNRTLGLLIGKGFYNKSMDDNSVVLEGQRSVKLVYTLLSDNQKTYTPLLNEVYNFFCSKGSEFHIDFQKLFDHKMKTVLTYGTFDLLHFGHVEILRRARKLGNRLIVGLSSDEFNEIKGKKCRFNYQKRKEMLEALKYVDLVIPEEDWEQKIDDVKNHKVDVFVMGSDWKGKFDFLKAYCEVIYLPRTAGISTTILKKLL